MYRAGIARDSELPKPRHSEYLIIVKHFSVVFLVFHGIDLRIVKVPVEHFNHRRLGELKFKNGTERNRNSAPADGSLLGGSTYRPEVWDGPGIP